MAVLVWPVNAWNFRKAVMCLLPLLAVSRTLFNEEKLLSAESNILFSTKLIECWIWVSSRISEILSSNKVYTHHTESLIYELCTDMIYLQKNKKKRSQPEPSDFDVQCNFPSRDSTLGTRLFKAKLPLPEGGTCRGNNYRHYTTCHVGRRTR